MPTLTIDGREVTVPEGTTILEAARSHGDRGADALLVPEAADRGQLSHLSRVRGGQPKLVASCAALAADGQKVTTESHAAVENRKAVLGMLLERYPVEEIPEGGARNEFEEYVRRYEVPTHKRSSLGLRTGDEREGDPLIQHDMSTCILCTRCVRACEDIQVVGVLETGVSRRARRDHRRLGWKSGARGMHVVRRVRARVSHRRDPRHHPARQDEARSRCASRCATCAACVRTAAWDARSISRCAATTSSA